jgi:TonB family protein
MLIAAAFIIGGSSNIQKGNFMLVSLFEELPHIERAGENKENNPSSPPFTSPLSSARGGGVKEGQGFLSENAGLSLVEPVQKGDNVNSGQSLIVSGNSSSPLKAIRAAIEKAKSYPLLARKKRIEGTTITVFTINNKGFPEDIKIKQSSGYEILDLAAIKIITKAAPFPEVNGEIIVPIIFKLTDPNSYH